jgi:hypothetical protein
MERLAEIFRWLKGDADVVTLRVAAEQLARTL